MKAQAARSLAQMAWRNLWRNHRRTLIMLTAIGLGVWAMIFMTALMRGMVQDMVDNAVANYLDHGQLRRPGYADDPAIEHRFRLTEALRLALDAQAADRQPLTWSPRLRLPAMITAERDSTGLWLLAIDPARDAPLSFLRDSIVEGRYLQDSHDQGLIIGAALARKLDTGLGRRLVLLSQDPDNRVADRGFRVVGIYRARLAAVEEQFVFTGLATAQALLGIQGQVTEIGWQSGDLAAAPAIARQLALAAPHLQSASWRDLDAYLGAMLDMMDGFVLVWILVIFTALSFGLVNTLAMAVFERVREFGLLKALGLRPAAILALVLAESALLILLGLALGNGLALLSVLAMADGVDLPALAQGMEMMGAGAQLRPQLSASDLALANGVVLALSLLASLLPASRAARLQPVLALNQT